MPPLSLLIKPASGNCNIRCKYCFYHSITESRQTESYGIMDSETLETLVKKSLEFADGQCTFAFQGGEPTLAGLDFYRNLIEFVNKYNIKKVQVNFAIQTNGVVIDDDWAKFFHDNKFLIGISLDGPKDIHDMYRYDAKGKGTYNQVMRAIDLFNKHKVDYNILCVVNSIVARRINKVYNFYKKNNFQYLQFIPCLDPLNEEPGCFEYSLRPERYTAFLKKLFDLWYEDIIAGNMISVRQFDNLVGMFMGYPPEACGMSGICNCQFVVEADGGTYPCDFYVIDEWYLGNLKDKSFEELKNGEIGRKFVDDSRHVSPECKECKYFNICRGGCRRSREPFVDDKPALNYFCPSYKEFYEYAGQRLQRLAQMFSQRK